MQVQVQLHPCRQWGSAAQQALTCYHKEPGSNQFALNFSAMAAAAAAALAQLLRAVRYPALDRFSEAEAAAGSPAPLLPILGFILLRFSKHVAALVSELGLQVCAVLQACRRCRGGQRGTPRPCTVAACVCCETKCSPVVP